MTVRQHTPGVLVNGVLPCRVPQFPCLDTRWGRAQ